MKIILKYSFLIFLCFAVLVSTAGVTVFKMVCGSSGKEVVSFEQFKKCCEESEETTGIQEECCDFTTYTLKLGLFQKNEIYPLVQAVLLQQVVFSFFMPFLSTKFSLSEFGSDALPQSGRQRLCLFCKYRI